MKICDLLNWVVAVTKKLSFVCYCAAGIYDEVKLMKKACGQAHLKAILATGELGTLTNVYRASLTAMMAGRYHQCFFSVG